MICVKHFENHHEHNYIIDCEHDCHRAVTIVCFVVQIYGWMSIVQLSIHSICPYASPSAFPSREIIIDHIHATNTQNMVLSIFVLVTIMAEAKVEENSKMEKVDKLSKRKLYA